MSLYRESGWVVLGGSVGLGDEEYILFLNEWAGG